MNDLSASELYAAGSALVLSGFIKEAYPLYEKSLEKSRIDNPSIYVTALREYALAMVMKRNMLNVTEARKKYLEALRMIADKQIALDPFNYVVDYAELSISELMYGDWACGSVEITGVLAKFEELKQSSLQNPMVVGFTEDYFRATAARKNKYAGQPEKGCDYEIPPIEIQK